MTFRLLFDGPSQERTNAGVQPGAHLIEEIAPEPSGRTAGNEQANADKLVTWSRPTSAGPPPATD